MENAHEAQPGANHQADTTSQNLPATDTSPVHLSDDVPRERGTDSEWRSDIRDSVAKGIRMLGVLKSEHLHADVYNEALRLAASYVVKTWPYHTRERT